MAGAERLPVLLVAYTPKSVSIIDRRPLVDSVTVGRRNGCDITVPDDKLSREHFRIMRAGYGHTIEDLGSKNGTYVDGRPIGEMTELHDQAVIRSGRVVFVYNSGATDLYNAQEIDNCGLHGKYHSARILRMLAQCSMSGHHLFFVGPAGSGKKITANAFATMMDKPIILRNAASLFTEEEALSTLFGEDDRMGIIEEADGGILFLDEVHYLPKRVQKRIEAVMEDGQFTRVGEEEPRKANVRFIFASQELLPIQGREKHLLAGARMIQRVPILPLQERRADIPSLFNYYLTRALKQVRVAAGPIMNMFSIFHYETLILDGFSDGNVKGLIGFAGDIAARIDSGTEPDAAIKQTFSKRYGTVYPAASLTDSNIVKVQRDTMEIKRPHNLPLDRYLAIEDSYRRHDGNVSAMERDLRNQGLKYSRQALAKILDSMNLPRTRKPRK